MAKANNTTQEIKNNTEEQETETDGRARKKPRVAIKVRRKTEATDEEFRKKSENTQKWVDKMIHFGADNED